MATSVVDFSQPDCISQIYPGLPLASQSFQQGFHVAHYRLSEHETPIYSPEQYVVGIHLDQPEIVEQWWAGDRFSEEKITYGDISIYPAQCPQRQRWNQTTDFIEIYISPQLFTEAAEQLFESDRISETPHLTIRDPLIQQLGLTLKAELNSSREANRLYFESIANLLVTHLLRHYLVPDRKAERLRDGLPQGKLKVVMGYIHHNLDRDLKLDELAAVAEMGTHYFAGLFKQSTGQPPHQYVTACRIEKAKSLLRERRLSIAEVCYEVGFQCQSHFTRVFRKHTGTTPGNYRSAI